MENSNRCRICLIVTEYLVFQHAWGKVGSIAYCMCLIGQIMHPSFPTPATHSPINKHPGVASYSLFTLRRARAPLRVSSSSSEQTIGSEECFNVHCMSVACWTLPFKWGGGIVLDSVYRLPLVMWRGVLPWWATSSESHVDWPPHLQDLSADVKSWQYRAPGGQRDVKPVSRDRPVLASKTVGQLDIQSVSQSISHLDSQSVS